MKKVYRPQPGEYEIGENEKYYGDMAAKGLLLEKRGAWFSRFRKGEPEARLYRVELAAPGVLDSLEDGGGELPEEQIALYEDSGWEFVARRGLLNIFSAPAGSGAPEFYEDSRRQAETLRALRRGYRWGWIPGLLVLFFNLFMAAAINGSLGGALAGLSAKLGRMWFAASAVPLAYAALLALGLFSLFYGGARAGALYRRLKRGEPLDHAPKRRALWPRLVRGVLGAALALFIVLTIVQWAGTETRPLPETADGPYLLLSALGAEGERTQPFSASTNTLETTRSLLAKMWTADEYVESGSAFYSLRQSVYVLAAGDPQTLARALMRGAIFADGPEDFEPAAVAGLDAAWRAGREYVALRGNTVWYGVLIASSGAELDIFAGWAENRY